MSIKEGRKYRVGIVIIVVPATNAGAAEKHPRDSAGVLHVQAPRTELPAPSSPQCQGQRHWRRERS